MRKSNREITDPADLIDILDRCDVCRIGLSTNEQPYIVPMNFGYRWDEHGLVLYFHGAAEGRKLDMIRQNHQACFEMDHRHELRPGDTACRYSMNYESIMGEGWIEPVFDLEEKLDALNMIMRHYSDRSDWVFDQSALTVTTVLRLRVKSFTGKRLKK